MKPLMLRRYGAECIGTFAYVFIGCGTRILEGGGLTLTSRLAVYLVFGFTLFMMTYAFSHISAAPFNPAIVVGLAVARRFPWRYVWPYWGAQILGALGASALHLLFLPGQTVAGQFGATVPTVDLWRAVGIEVVITFFLMVVVMASATDRRVNRAATGMATGVTVALGGLFAGPLTGGSMNPARSLAPALFAGGKALAVVWVYWVGPLLGSILGALLYEALRGGQQYAVEVPEGIFDDLPRARHQDLAFPTASSVVSIQNGEKSTAQIHDKEK